jgi:hypothetical protein
MTLILAPILQSEREDSTFSSRAFTSSQDMRITHVKIQVIIMFLILPLTTANAASRCGIIKDDKIRLICFDNEQLLSSARSAAYKGEYQSASNNSSKEDVALRVKLRGICRGC